MKSIPTIFQREQQGRHFLAVDRWVPECEWVRDGEGVATRKWDGSACLVKAGVLYKRLQWNAKNGAPPAGWMHHNTTDPQQSGHGWMIVRDGPEDWMHRLMQPAAETLPDGTYELVGPKMGKNKERLTDYMLLPHGAQHLDAPRDFEGLRQWLSENGGEGIVWHHPDGRMAKLKRRDFGIPW